MISLIELTEIDNQSEAKELNKKDKWSNTLKSTKIYKGSELKLENTRLD